MTTEFKTLVPAKITSEPKEIRRWLIRESYIGSETGIRYPASVEEDRQWPIKTNGLIQVVEATALTEAERTIAILRDKQTQHESTLLETMRVRDEAEREIVELKREALGALSKREIEFEQDNAKLRAQVEEIERAMIECYRSDNELPAGLWCGDALVDLGYMFNEDGEILEKTEGGPDGEV